MVLRIITNHLLQHKHLLLCTMRAIIKPIVDSIVTSIMGPFNSYALMSLTPIIGNFLPNTFIVPSKPSFIVTLNFHVILLLHVSQTTRNQERPISFPLYFALSI